MTQYTYCPKCNKDVEVIEISSGTRGAESTLRCSECGTILATMRKEEDKAAGGIRVVSAGFTPAQVEALTDSFVKNAYAHNIINCNNGDEFLTLITKLLRAKKRPRLVIIEVAIPIMNGINAAICMRSIEKAVSREKIPILYFTQRPLDDQFVRAIKFLNPAKYVPVPPNTDIQDFRRRTEKMVELLKKEGW